MAGRGGYTLSQAAALGQQNTEAYKQARAEYEAKKQKEAEIIAALNSGNLSALDAQGQLAQAGIQLSPEMTQWLNNSLAKQTTDEANAFTKEMRDSSYTSAASQLQELGMNPGSVLTTGGAGIGSSHSADFSKENTAQENKINQFNQNAQTTRTILSLVGGLASAGIHGGALVAARKSASKLASATAHSADSMLDYYSSYANFRKFDTSPSSMSWDDIESALGWK